MAQTPRNTPARPIEHEDNPQTPQLHGVAHVHHEGPLPMAAEYAAYDRVHKGSAHRILKMAEKSLDAEIHHMKMHGRIEFISMLSGRLFMYALLGVALTLALTGHQDAAAFAAIPPLASALYGTFKPAVEKQTTKKRKQRK